MDAKTFTERLKRLEEIGKAIDKLPAEIRVEAFNLLTSYVSDVGGGRKEAKDTDEEVLGDAAHDGSLFTKFTDGKPSDNAKLIAASFFNQYGSAAFTIDELKKKAADVGVTIPERVDATFDQAAVKGKKLFTRSGRGSFKPTVYGEDYFKKRYGVKKGTTPRAAKTE